jgi:hypothetical protein
VSTKVKETLSNARASVAGLIERPSTSAELDGCVAALDELAVAVRRLPSLPFNEQAGAADLVGVSLLNIRNIIKRRPK